MPVLRKVDLADGGLIFACWTPGFLDILQSLGPSPLSGEKGVHKASSISVELVMASCEFGMVTASKGGFSTVVAIGAEDDLRKRKSSSDRHISIFDRRFNLPLTGYEALNRCPPLHGSPIRPNQLESVLAEAGEEGGEVWQHTGSSRDCDALQLGLAMLKKSQFAVSKLILSCQGPDHDSHCR